MTRFFSIARRVCLIVLLLCGIAAAQPAPFTPPAESFDVKNQMPPLTAAIEQRNFADAAARIDALLQGGSDAMFASSPEVMISLKAWTESLSGPVREGIETEYDKIAGPSAKQALEAAVTKPGSTPEDFITVANTYPFAASARDAWGRAAMRAIDFGDVSAAMVLSQRAKALGWKPTDGQKSLLDAITKLSLPNGNAMQFATPWYGADPPATTKRVIPVLAGGTVFVATERGVMASKENGELLWQSVSQKPDPKAEPSMTGARFGFHRPAVLCDSTGKPQVVIVRLLVSGTRFGCLRAFRASDGKPLWTTESAAMGSWSMVSAPVVAGRVTMVIGIDDSVRPAPVGVFAFETMTGRLLWQSQVGGYANMNEGRELGTLREVDMLWSNSGVGIDGSDVFVNAGQAMTFCLDRFDGKIKWIRTYTPTLTPGDDLIAAGRRTLRHEPGSNESYKQKQKELKARLGDVVLQVTPVEGERKFREISAEVMALGMYFSQPPRWLSTPAVSGDNIIVAGGDMGGVVALDRKSGAQAWENLDELKDATFIGVAGDNAVFAGSQLRGLDIRTAKVVWTWAVPNDGTISGPPSMIGKAVRVVSGKTTYVISSDTGKPDPLTTAGANFTSVLASEASRNALNIIDAYDSFAAATVQKAPPAREVSEPKDPRKKK